MTRQSVLPRQGREEGPARATRYGWIAARSLLARTLYPFHTARVRDEPADRLDPSDQRPARRGPFRRPFPVGGLSDSSVGSPFGLTRSGSTSELPWTSLRIPVIVTAASPTVCVRCSRTGLEGCGCPTCDAGGSSCRPLFCECAPGANGTFNLGSSYWWRHDPTGGEAVKRPVCDVGSLTIRSKEQLTDARPRPYRLRSESPPRVGSLA